MEPIDPNENRNKKPILPPICSLNIRRNRPQHGDSPPPMNSESRIGSSSAPFMSQRQMFLHYPTDVVMDPAAIVFPHLYGMQPPPGFSGASSSKSQLYNHHQKQPLRSNVSPFRRGGGAASSQNYRTPPWKPNPVFPQMPEKIEEGSLIFDALDSTPSRAAKPPLYPSPTLETPCIYFAKGTCFKGESCNFRHQPVAEAVGKTASIRKEEQPIDKSKTASSRKEEQLIDRSKTSSSQKEKRQFIWKDEIRALEKQEIIPSHRDWSPVDDGIVVCFPSQPDHVPTREEVIEYIDDVLLGCGCGRRERSRFMDEFPPEDGA